MLNVCRMLGIIQRNTPAKKETLIKALVYLDFQRLVLLLGQNALQELPFE